MRKGHKTIFKGNPLKSHINLTKYEDKIENI